MLRRGAQLVSRRLTSLSLHSHVQRPFKISIKPHLSLQSSSSSLLSRLSFSSHSQSSPSQPSNPLPSSTDDDVPSDVTTEELRKRIKKFSDGDVGALPFIFEAILARKLSGNHEDTDDEIMEELGKIRPHGDEGADGDDSSESGEDSSESGEDSSESGEDSSESGEDSSESGEDSSESGEDSSESGEDSSESGEDSSESDDDL